MFVNAELKVKDDSESGVTIEGWANKAVVDDVGDLLKFDQVDMDRFKKNPIMFFNHDRDLPIGKVIETKLSPDGLWVKGIISKSQNKIVSYVRDLVKEGILKTFSIGFEIQDEQKQSNANVINKWRLNEISVVTLPCNTEAEFSLAKSLGEKDFQLSKLRLKGAYLAAELAKLELQDEALQALAEKLGVDLDTLKKVFMGDLTPVPEELIAKLAEEFKLNAEALLLLNKAEDELQEPKEPEMPEEMPSEVEDACKPKKPEMKADSFQECVSKKIPKLIEEGKTQEQAVAIAMSMCSEEGKCHIDDITPEMLQQAQKIAAESQPLPKQDPSDFGNPYMDMMKSQLALLGNISKQMGDMIAMLDLIASKLQPPPVATPEKIPDNNVSEEQRALDEIKAISERIKKMI